MNCNLLLLETDFYKVLTNKIGKCFDEGFAINKSAILSISGKGTVLLLLVDVKRLQLATTN